MLLTKEQAEKRLNSKENLVNILADDKINRIPFKVNAGWQAGYRIPDFIKVTAGIMARTRMDTQANIADALDMGQNEVSKLKRSINTMPHVEKQIKDRTDDYLNKSQAKCDQIKDKALEKIMETLGYIGPDNLEATNAQGLSNIANNLSSVVEKMKPQDTKASVVQLNVYAPQMKTEASYKVIEVKR